MRELTLPGIASRRASAVRTALTIVSGPQRIRRKPRSPEERAMIIGMAASGLRRRVEAGRLTVDGPRSYTVITGSLKNAAEPTVLPPSTPGANR